VHAQQFLHRHVGERTPAGEQFGAERLAAVFAAAPADPDAVVEEVLTAIRRFAGGAEPYDDITMVALARDRGDL